MAIVDQTAINIICQNQDIMLQGPSTDGFQFFPTVNHPRWIGGGIEQDQLGLFSPSSFKLFNRSLEIIGFSGLEGDGYCIDHLDLVYIGNPTWRWDDDFIARIEQGGKGCIEDKFGSCCNHHLVARDRIAIEGLHIAGNRIL